MQAQLIQNIRNELRGRTAISRFAPSVTGYLHLGHLVNAIYVWGITRALHGKVLLRLEDHDRTRFRPEYESGILEVLESLGLEYDNADAFSGGSSDFRQSDCKPHYEAFTARLREQTHVYACTCSRRIIEARIGSSPGELVYDGFCRDRGIVPGKNTTLRVLLPEEPVSFTDQLMGPQTQIPARQCGDVPIRDRRGNWTYQLCVVADDIRQGVNMVIRGSDILSSTGRQLMLYKLSQTGEIPVYLHHPLVRTAKGRKLSKRDFDAPVIEMLKSGISPEELLGKAVRMAGLSKKAGSIKAKDLPNLFAE